MYNCLQWVEQPPEKLKVGTGTVEALPKKSKKGFLFVRGFGMSPASTKMAASTQRHDAEQNSVNNGKISTIGILEAILVT